MKLHSNHNHLAQPPIFLFRGFTLVEMMVAMALAGLLISSLVILGMYTSKCFFMIGNYADLDKQSRNAMDVLSREIRDASSLVAFSTNSPAYLQLTNTIGGYGVTVTYYANNGTLTFAKTGQATETLLTDCDNWNFSLFQRHPLITSTDITFFPATDSAGAWDPTVCKVIDMTWTCSRKILGSKMNTENVQTAEIVLRNQMK